MTHLLTTLLALLFSLSGPAMGRNASFWQSSFATEETNTLYRVVGPNELSGREPFSWNLTSSSRLDVFPPNELKNCSPTSTGSLFRHAARRWWADLDLRKGTNTLVLTATLPNGLYTTNATSIFTNTDAGESITNLYDGSGNATVRIWKNGSGGTNRTQTLTWDGLGRLVKESLRDAFTNGYDRTCIYDGLGRRIRTIHSGIVSNVYQASVTTDSYYDPSVEFLETEIICNGQRYWKIYGPDLNGVHGGLQGIGGLEAVFAGAGGLGTAMVSDHFGNIVGTNLTVQTTSFGWLPGRFCSYGPVAGYQQPELSLNTAPPVVFGYLGKRVDETGRIYFGAREYVPDERRWLSYDSMGWNGGSHPYGFCNGSPGYFMDPDGRQGMIFPSTTVPPLIPPVQQPTDSEFTANLSAAMPAYSRFTGVAGLVGHTIETTIGVFASEIVIGVPVAAHGVDGIFTDLRQIWTGQPQSSLTSRSVSSGLESLGVDRTYSQYGGTAFDMGASFASGLVRLGPAPSTTWSTSLAAGQGETDMFGNRLLSSLGSDLDRAQAELHEGMHSLFSPSEYSLFGPWRAEAGIAAYQNSQLFRYAEEAIAETAAQLGTRGMTGLSFGEAVGTGLRFPLNGSYEPMTLLGIASEAGIGAAALGVAGAGAYMMSTPDANGSASISQDPGGKYYKHK